MKRQSRKKIATEPRPAIAETTGGAVESISPAPIQAMQAPLNMPVRDRLQAFLTMIERTKAENKVLETPVELSRYILAPQDKTRGKVSWSEPVDEASIKEILKENAEVEVRKVTTDYPYNRKAFKISSLNFRARREMMYSDNLRFDNYELLLECLSYETIFILVEEFFRLEEKEISTVLIKMVFNPFENFMPELQKDDNGQIPNNAFMNHITDNIDNHTDWTPRVATALKIMDALINCWHDLKSNTKSKIRDSCERCVRLEKFNLNLAHVFQLRMQLFMEDWREHAERGTQTVEGASIAGNKRRKTTDEECLDALNEYQKNHSPATKTVARHNVAKKLGVSFDTVKNHTGGRVSRQK